MHDIKIPKCKISNVINQKEKVRQSVLIYGKKTANEYLKKVYISNVCKLK